MNDEKLNNQEYPAANREYKDRLFRFVFRKKEDQLSLYNAVNGTHYTDPDALEINTLDNVLYLGMKNDISFLISGTMNLYEHQSTYNPNMPIRGLMYFSKLYEKYIAENNIDIYTNTRKELPFPQYLVFYNGTADEPERMELKLSHMFRNIAGTTPQNTDRKKEACLECIATMLNINYGHNKELMEKCRRLKEYAIFVDTVRRNLSPDIPLHTSLMQAIDECIERGIMPDILVSQKAEVIQMLLETFDQEKHDEAMKKDWYEAGKADGFKIGKANGEKIGIEKGIRGLILTLRERSVSEEEIKNTLQEIYEISSEDAEKYLTES
ncbi:hypothetical protein [Lachnoclostridium sp. An169]|uniref:hypothetical protein n=1 Tax=Lachnoclostridium sp. An169 TaxID=1965569 RepID=UPI001FA8654C|nr:hypothetical protein [Lachnoclostridium sp. An169]